MADGSTFIESFSPFRVSLANYVKFYMIIQHLYDPMRRDGDALRAVACACTMQLAMGAVNEKIKELDLPPLEMGIGINTGEVVVGNIGSEQRTKYGIVGNQVNLTYRIESYTKGGQILISEQTLKDAGSSVRIEGKKQVQPKRLKRPITIYDVYGVGGFYNLYLPKQEELFFLILEEMPVQYSNLQEKHIANTVFTGTLAKLSNKGAEIRIDDSLGEDSLPSELTNIKLNLLLSNNPVQLSEDIYAKVVKILINERSFYIHFTTISTNLKSHFDAIYNSITK